MQKLGVEHGLILDKFLQKLNLVILGSKTAVLKKT